MAANSNHSCRVDDVVAGQEFEISFGISSALCLIRRCLVTLLENNHELPRINKSDVEVEFFFKLL